MSSTRGDADCRARFERIRAEHEATLTALARTFCRDGSDVDDLLQSAWEHALRRIESLRDESKARGWLTRILRNCFLDGCRRRRRETLVAEVPDVERPVEPLVSPWERVTADDLRRAIENLREPLRSAAILHYLDGDSYQAMAERLGLPYATVATRVHRARLRLKEILTEWLGGTEPDEDGHR
jgi:RNA polymerase sigma-70 factor, ECF subfamily